ncbi:MAG TPA: Txe/YoeB family addiction module toxin [Rhodothermales bacterium]|nr:Txe/YoeB family addiction module toxin [Rhodothermales bacterium]
MRAVEFSTDALEDFAWWIEHDRKVALRIVRLLTDVQRTPFEGAGKPEPLKRELKGAWSRRITQGTVWCIR